MSIEDVLKESCVIADIKGTTKKDVLFELVYVLKKAMLIENVEKAVNVILEREKLGSTGIGDGVAIPHGKTKSIHNILCAFGRSQEGVDFNAVDRKPVHIFFLLLAPEDSASLHLKMLSRISKILRDLSFRKKLMELTDTHEIYTSIIEEDKRL
ncbi:MAG: PTS sugar transporter subunit IIA [Proteobacteria bacterium]|jgi:PTS system nitrogen regulatory IIA component|nr:PTS sugar transporter subunit IIA [Pseudomonadota bacterium]